MKNSLFFAYCRHTVATFRRQSNSLFLAVELLFLDTVALSQGGRVEKVATHGIGEAVL